MSCLLKICMNVKKNDYYIISIFYCNDLDLLEYFFSNFKVLMEKLCLVRIYIFIKEKKLVEMVNNFEIDILNLIN